MAGNSSGGAFLIIFILAILFFAPLIEKQFFIIDILGDNENAKIGDTVIKNIMKPPIDIFSKQNPQGNLKLNVEIKNETGVAIITGDLLNLGNGNSIFSIKSTKLRGKLTITSTLYFNNQIIDKKDKEVILP